MAREGVGDLTKDEFLAKHFDGYQLDASRFEQESKARVAFHVRFKFVEKESTTKELKWENNERRCVVCGLEAHAHTCKECEW